jgi:hypothetical protein
MEEFKIINDNSNYSISNYGNVKNNITNRILKKYNYNDYERVKLKNKDYKIHRLVAIHFIDNPENKLFVDHIDNNRTNNHFTNLRWVTTKENNYNRKLTYNNIFNCKGIRKWVLKNNVIKYQALITIDKKQINLGFFNLLEDAIIKRKTTAMQIFGIYANISDILT